MEGVDDIGSRGAFRDDHGTVTAYPKGSFGFCTSPTQADHEEYRRTGKLPAWNPARHKDSKNPVQCEVAFMLDLVQGKGFREDPFNIGKNIGAGIINAIVPGSDLGDSWSEGQKVGRAIGSAVGLFVPAPKLPNMGFLNTIINTATKAVSSPLGQLAANILPSVLLPTPYLPYAGSTGPVTAAQNPPATFPQQRGALPNIAEPKQTAAQALTFGDVPIGKTGVYVGQSQWYKTTGGIIGIVIGAIAFVFLGWLLLFKRK